MVSGGDSAKRPGPMALLEAAFHDPDTRACRIVAAVVWSLIGISGALVVIDLALGGPEGWLASHPGADRLLRTIDRAILWVFVVELALRLISFRPAALDLFSGGTVRRLRAHLAGRLRHLLSPLVLIDVLAVLALVPALRGLRLLRLLRLVRFSKVLRYSNPVMGILRAFEENALLYAFSFGFLLIVVLLGGVSMYLVESRHPGAEVRSIPDGIWWALVTITTVGYGDFAPVTVLGRLVAGVVMVLGVVTLALFAGVVGGTLIRVLMSLRQDQFRMSSYANHIVICGYDTAVPMLLRALAAEPGAARHEIVVFAPGERPPELPPEVIWVPGDPLRESELEKVRIAYARAAIVVGSRRETPSRADSDTIMIAFTLRSYLAGHPDAGRRQHPLYIVAEILDPENVAHARTAGADEVIETTRLGFSLLAHAALVPGSGTIMSSVASAGAHSLYLGSVPADEPITYERLTETLHDRFGAILIGVRNPTTGRVSLDPDDATLVPLDWQVVYLARGPVLPESGT